MTTERATPPAGFDTLAEARRLEAAGVPAEHGAAMLYAAIAASDARNAELREEAERRHAELREESERRHAELREEMERRHAELRRDNADLRKDNARLRKDTERSNAQLRKDTERSNAQLRKDTKRDIEIAQWKTIAGVSVALLATSGVIIAGVKFVLEWPFG